jgi:hypothetical protein
VLRLAGEVAVELSRGQPRRQVYDDRVLADAGFADQQGDLADR